MSVQKLKELLRYYCQAGQHLLAAAQPSPGFVFLPGPKCPQMSVAIKKLVQAVTLTFANKICSVTPSWGSRYPRWACQLPPDVVAM